MGWWKKFNRLIANPKKPKSPEIVLPAHLSEMIMNKSGKNITETVEPQTVNNNTYNNNFTVYDLEDSLYQKREIYGADEDEII